MPYIKKERRLELSTTGWGTAPNNPGELNFEISMICKDYMNLNGLSYATINDIIGALECAKLEFVRRIVNNYEDKKIVENGDIYNVD